MKTLHVYFDYVCPWCYFGSVRIEQLRREFNLDVRYCLFPLYPETPEEGLSLHDLFQGRLDINAVLAGLQRVATELELPFGNRTHTYNSRNAQELGKWSEEQGIVEPFHDAVYRAYFVDGKNIARIDVLMELVSCLGLDTAEAEQSLLERRYAAAVDADWEKARSTGVTAVPTTIYQDRSLVGFNPYQAFRELVANN